jgi:hypothetical protein
MEKGAPFSKYSITKKEFSLKFVSFLSLKVKMEISTILKGMSKMAEKKKKDKDRGKYPLTSMQEVSYQREFKMADRAGGYHDRKTKL